MTEATQIRRLLQIMERLRSPQGCPWDREQTHKSMVNDLIEECYEVVEAIQSGHPEQMRDELGDLLLQVVFHAQIAAENNEFEFEDVVRSIGSKLVRRHPHVFADTQVDSVDEVLANWDAIKGSESAHQDRTSLLDGIPKSFPALLRAEKMQRRAARVGFDWKNASETLAKIREETDELQKAIELGDADQCEAELGDLLFSVVNAARHLSISPEAALHRTASSFSARFEIMEALAEKEGRPLEEMTLTELDSWWEKAKRQLLDN